MMKLDKDLIAIVIFICLTMIIVGLIVPWLAVVSDKYGRWVYQITGYNEQK